MKWVSIMLLFILAITVLAPLSLFTVASAGSDQPTLGNLDVCNAATPALFANGEMPCVTASICIATPLLTVSTNDSLQKMFVELILSSRNEQPPRA
jgi:hypothetical protein